MRFRILLLLLVLSIPPAAEARQVSQDEVAFSAGATDLPIRFENITLEDGLSQSTVYDIHQDRKGFMWFGTQIGLNRYDGEKIVSFLPDPFDSTSIHDTYIWEIEESDDGKLWLTYEDGSVGRFDPATGKSRNFLSSPTDSTRLVSGRTTGFFIDSKGRHWVSAGGGIGGLQLLDPDTGTVTRYGTGDWNGGRISWTDRILEQPDGNLLVVGGRGIWSFDPDAGSFELLVPVESGAINAVWDPHHDGILWTGTLGQGALRYDFSDGSTRFYDVTKSNQDRVVQAQPDPTTPDVIWASTLEGIARLDAVSGGYRSYRSGSSGTNSANTLLNNSIGAIYADRSGILWASAGGSGVSRFDPTAIGFGRETANPDNPNAMRGQVVWRILPTTGNVLWVAAQGSETSDPGYYLNRIDRTTGRVQFWKSNALSAAPLLERRDGTFLFGSWPDPNEPLSGGVFAYNPRTGNLDRRYTVAQGSVPDDRISDLLESSDGTLWIATRGGAVRLGRDGSRRLIPVDPESPEALKSGLSMTLLEDVRGDIWIMGRGELARLRGGTGPLEHMLDRDGIPPFISEGFPRTTALGLEGDIWFAIQLQGRPSVLIRYLPNTDSFVAYEQDLSDRTTWSGGSVTGIHPHPTDPDRVYFSTYGAGMSKLTVSTGAFRHYRPEDGLTDQSDYEGIFDQDGQLWIPSNSGLFRFDPDDETFRRFGLEYGLQSLEFNEGAIARTESGELFFGGVQGFNAFFPSQLRSNDVPPDVAITEFLLFNERVTPGPESPLSTSILDTKSITLPHDQDSPSFRFAALHYKRPEANRIRYRLEPQDADWIEADGRNEASYTNLRPGSYTFRVIAANSDGVWNENGASLSLTILAPWYTSWWAYLLYLCMLGGLVFGVDRVQRRRVVLKEREATRERELAQAREIEKQHRALEQSHSELKATQAQLVEQEKLASLGSLTAGIAHEIKNPLNFVNNFAEVSSELAEELREAAASGDTESMKGIIEDLLQNTAQITKHGKRADSIVRAMMQHARGGASEKEVIDVNEFVGEYVGLAWHGMRARDHGFQAEVERAFADDTGTIQAQPQELGRVLVNLLNNAFQALLTAGTKGAIVLVSTRRVGSSVEITISDNGPGIPVDIRSKIFEPFFTTKTTGEGTGLGLSLSYDIITKGHGGTMTVRESPQGGAEFVITLPGA